ncbi:MAG: hypothetical protein ACRDQ7_12720 [Haloechinothrix sp.]
MHSDDNEAAVAPSGMGYQVEPGELLAAAKIIEAQANTLADRLVDAAGTARVDAPAQDVVSVHVTEAWNALVAEGDGGYLGRVNAYLDSLRALAMRLRAAAAVYQHDDDAAVASFAHRGPS